MEAARRAAEGTNARAELERRLMAAEMEAAEAAAGAAEEGAEARLVEMKLSLHAQALHLITIP